MRVSIIVPCYNEESSLALLGERLAEALPLLSEHDLEVLFIDDGSTDGTLSGLELLAEKLGCARIISHGCNRGLGQALRTGYAAATGDAIVALDSDCTYDPVEIPNLLGMLEHADVVLGSPYHPNGHVDGVPPHRLILSSTLSNIYRIVLRTPEIHTFTAIFRVYTREAARDAVSVSDDYLALTEALISLLRTGHTVIEYPTTLHTRVTGASKLRVLRMIRRHLGMVARLAFRRAPLGDASGEGVKSWQPEQ